MARDEFGNYICDIEPAPAPYPDSPCACRPPDSGNDYSGILYFVGSSLTMTGEDIAAVDGVVVQDGHSWREVHGHDCLGLYGLSVENNLITIIELDNNPALAGLSCQGNQLALLSIGGLGALTNLQCNNNQLTLLDVSDSPLLEVLYCSDNLLTELDVGSNPQLKNLDCSGNQLSALDVSANPLLESLVAYGMPITTVDISGNPNLTHIDFGGNPLTVETVDNMLIALDGFGLSNGLAALFATAAPSEACATARANLVGRGWELQLDGA